MNITLPLLQEMELPMRLEVVLNQKGTVTCRKELCMSCTEGMNEIVLEELAPFTVELLVHWQLVREEAV